MSDHFKGWKDGHLPPPNIPEQEPAEQIKEGGGQVLDIAAIPNNSVLVRDGTDIAGQGIWQSWSPTITYGGGSTNPTSASIHTARYCQIGKLVYFRAEISVTRGGGNRTTMALSAPVSVATGGNCYPFVSQETLTSATQRYAQAALIVVADNKLNSYLNGAMSVNSGWLRISGFYEVA